ncbi:MFS transporter [Neokomagataea tanensis]|uniref:MFS transporter n=1 Tax=Neokomagataea tanensis TaxID=661191 RepID=A0A4Y6V6U4_9PROT|nr:MFS transporter [Neokomagataea tanensis]
MATEVCVGFSQYGLQSIFVLYLTKSLLLPGHLENVVGFDVLAACVKAIYAPIGTKAMAAGITGLFLTLIFAVPMVGGYIADRFLGRTRTISLGVVMLTCGHFLMSFEASFVFALIFLVAGFGAAGGMKAQIGGLYAVDDPRRTEAYQYFQLFFQMAPIASPLICGALAQSAWHWGFAAAGAGMLVGMLIYLAGLKWLPAETPRKTGKNSLAHTKLTKAERRSVIGLVAILPVLALAALPNQEIFDGYMLWAEDHYQLTLLGYDFPISSLVSLDAFIGTLAAVLVLAFWRIYAKIWNDPAEITKVAVATLIAAIGPLFLICGEYFFPGKNAVSPLWGVAFHTFNNIGFGMNYAIGMAMFSRVAPARFNTVLVAGFVLHLSVANLIVGKLSTLIDRIPDTVFWLLHSLGALGGGIILLLCAIFLKDIFDPKGEKA